MALDLSTKRFVQLTEGIVVVPNSATDLTTKTSWVEQIVVANTTGTAATLLVKDKQGTPLQLIPTVSVAANSVLVYTFPRPVKMLGGINWQAGTASALNAEVKGYRLP